MSTGLNSILTNCRSLAVASALLRAVEPALAQTPATKPQSSPQAAAPAAPAPAPETVVMLARTTLIALNQANQTGDFSVLHTLAAPQLQRETDVKKLAEAFAGFRQRNIDLSPVVMFAPQLVQPPQIDQQGPLRVVGLFPTTPLQIRFSLAYRFVDGRWRPEGLNLDAAPAPQGQAAAQPDPGVQRLPAALAPPPPAAAQNPPPRAAKRPPVGAASATPAVASAAPAIYDKSTNPPTTNRY